MILRRLLPLVLLAACGGDKDPTGPVDTEDTEPTTTTESGTPAPDEVHGFVHVLRLGDDAFSDGDQTVAFAGFARDDLGSINYFACLIEGYCFTDLGASGGQPVVTVAYTNPILLDGGEVTVGTISLPVDPAYDVASTSDFAWPSGPAEIVIAGGSDFGPYSGGAEATFPVMELLTPSSTSLVPIAPGASLDLTWTPGGDGELLITVFSDVGVTFLRAEDDGATTVPANAFGFSGALGAASVVVSRMAYGGDSLDEYADFKWWVEDRRTVSLDFRNLGDIRELASTEWSEDCAGLKTVPSLAPGEYFLDTSAALDDLDLGYGNPLTDFATEGPEVFVPVDLLPGQQLDVTWRTTFGDASLYLLTDACDPASGITGADGTYANEEEAIDYTATVAETVIVVLDTFDRGSPGLVDIQVQ